ncbi:DEAD/DEAH box helicase [Antarcticibacterium flavum]|uniref:DEAD/DEAH box helicase n=1 Tax=Antarcticibacterium flavum TaxID=2058175 RepID=A0A5B7WYM8_9FLAO|nr:MULTISPECIES: DEAD/DEAH box helicase [Antarcticibacterium]MCM4158914.1 helicase [Antarcticibacterium sp. W02-3]QCY68170.1 DEAD/DEAH box helicase [Antarcticibacterium flavum]
MSKEIKDREAILQKMGIENLNSMQLAAHKAIIENPAVVLLSPTGSGKTLAFLLPVLELLSLQEEGVQVLILVPSRELAIQIEQVTREMGSGYKANAVYGGRAFSKDREELSHPPAILIGTPGRVADHLRRQSFGVESIQTLVLDEFDKSLEVGFEEEMKEIIQSLPHLNKKILTSATNGVRIPQFSGVNDPVQLNFLKEELPDIVIKIVADKGSKEKETLARLLQEKQGQRGIIFCNFKDSIQEVSDHFENSRIEHGIFHGGMEQKDRERSLIKFRNGTYNILLATDLAARGIDVPEIDFIVHYELPLKEQEFIHRNGRTARMQQSGTAYVIKGENKKLPDFINGILHTKEPGAGKAEQKHETSWKTLFISGGRKDKISKGDIAGLFLKQGNLEKEELGNIELKQDCAFVSVPSAKAEKLVGILNNSRLKKKKVRIYPI